MELCLTKYEGKDKESKREFYSILDYTVLIQNTTLLLVEDGKMSADDDTGSNEFDFHSIYKVQFIASCKIDIAPAVIVAFYIGEAGLMHSYVLDGLPRNYAEDVSSPFFCIDYKSYSDLCELTGETKLSLPDYIKMVKSGSLGSNSFLYHNDTPLNFNKQKELWDKIDSKKAVSLN